MNRNRTTMRRLTLAACLAAGLVCTAASADGQRAQPEAQQRLPVLALTDSLGDIGFEIFDEETRRYTLESLPENADAAMVYIDIDSMKELTAEAAATLTLAKQMGWPVVLESATWDVDGLHDFVARNIPGEVSLKSLENVALRLQWRGDEVSLIDTTPTEIALEVGLPFESTSEARASSDLGKAVNFTAWFASAAYRASPGNAAGYTLRMNADVVKVWSNGNSCIVSWRGTNSVGDWLRNAESQFGRAVRVPHYPTSNTARIGHGYASRLVNYQGRVNTGIGSTNCYNVHITGHSLGGAMAEAYAFYMQNAPRRRTAGLIAYNPARVGNASFKSQLRADLRSDSSGFAVYCRHGDPVWAVPLGLQHVGDNSGCTNWGARVSWTNPVANHAMSLWL